MYGQKHFAADFHWQAGEHTQRVDDSTIGAILNRHYAVSGLAPNQFIEDSSNVATGTSGAAIPKCLAAAR